MDNLYLVSSGLIYNLREDRHGRRIPVSPEDMGEYRVILADEYFFYLRVGKLNVKKRKVAAVIENYLNSIFPMELFGGFIISENKGVYTALIYKREFLEHIASLSEFLNRAKKISTAFCELSQNYDEFIFQAGDRFYESKGETLTVIPPAKEAISADDYLEGLGQIKCDLDLPLLRRSKGGIKGYYKAIAAFAAAFLLFIGGNFLTLTAAKKSEKELSAQLTELYKAAGVEGEADPYGALGKLIRQESAPRFSGLAILSAAGAAAGESITLETFSVNDRSVRLEGKAADFAAVENMVKGMEDSLKKAINLEDSRQAEDKIAFTVRYIP
jgi:hypothetical protein